MTPFLIIYASAGWEFFVRPEMVRGSRLAAWVSTARSRLIEPASARIENWLDRKRRLAEGFLSSPVKNTGKTLITAVLVNSLLLFLKNTEWTLWSVTLRLGLLGLGMWALRVRFDWKRVREMSSLRAFLVS